MGIRGLTGWIAWAAPTAIQQPAWHTWKGKHIGVDILGFLYRAKAQSTDPLHFLATFIVATKRLGIRITPIFDGKPPDEKRHALAQRSAVRNTSDEQKKVLLDDLESVPMTQEQRTVVESKVKTLTVAANYLTSEERDKAKQLFYAAGIVPLNATGEADNVLAYFCKRDMFDAVMSNDLDLLARGVETLLVPEPYALPGDKCGWKVYSLSGILKEVGFSYQQFVEMCVLMGSDYTSSQRTLPYKSAFWSIKYRGDLKKTLEFLHIHDASPYERAYTILVGSSETAESLMGAKQWEKLASDPPPIEHDALAEFRKSHLLHITDDEFQVLSGAA